MELTRRSLIVSAGKLTSTALAAASGASSLTADSSAPPSSAERKIKVVVCGGHPGDPEYGCGATAALLTAFGHQVDFLYLNDGAWPPASASTRAAEAAKACEILHARPAYAGQVNSAAIVDSAHYEDYHTLLMTRSPDAVLTHWPIDNHADHRAITMLTYNSWNKSGKKFALYYYEVSNGEDTLQFAPNRYVDISGVEARKRAACYAHASQTPDRYYELQDAIARFRGLEGGYKRAEAFLLQSQSPHDIFPIAQNYSIK